MSLVRRAVIRLLALSLVFSGMAQAAPLQLIGTEQAAAAQQPAPANDSHARLLALLDRADLAAALQERGVGTDQLRDRVQALTDAEAADMLRQIDSAPAGGDVLGLLFTLFIILLITDILGLTKVFPFTRPVR